MNRAVLLTIIESFAKQQHLEIQNVSKAAVVIERMTEQRGCRVAARTIENYLRRIKQRRRSEG